MSVVPILPPSQSAIDPAQKIPPHRRRHLRVWLWAGATLTFLILVIGGITRLTQSGLSIVDWRPIMGVIPPLSEADWLAKFDAYRQYPEYRQLRQGMSLDEFKFIYFWEYLHRLAARVIGLVFLVPFVVFALKRYFTPPLLRRALVLFGLGAFQGLLGWLMVASGLVDQPNVSHYRLAAHLSIAFVIFGVCLWTAADLADRPPARPPSDTGRLVRRGLYVIGALLALQIIWGAFVAGLKAGLVYNTFPLMGSSLMPSTMFSLSPILTNFVENPVAVQWTHRVLGTVLALASIGLLAAMWRRRAPRASMRWGMAFVGLLVVQYVLGVITLLYFVPVALGVTHQAVAMVLFGVWLLWLHREQARPGNRQ